MKGVTVITEYNQNKDFKRYVDAYCAKTSVAPEVAVTHVIVKLVEEEYKKKRLGQPSLDYGREGV